MTPVTSSARRLMAYLGLWLLAGLALSGALVNAAWAAWLPALVLVLPMAVCLGFVVASAYYVCRSVVLAQRSGFQTVVVFGAASALSGGMWALLCQGWNVLAASLLALAGMGPNTLEPSASGLLVAMPSGALIMLFLLAGGLYLISLLIHDIWLAADQVRAAQEREAQSLLQARDAQLQMLRTQINPHFLFNSLNSISALTSQNAAAARAMTLELAAFFRQTLALAEKERIPLEDEVALCEHFFAVEKIRFGDKLRTDIRVSDAARAVLIPPMLLQPCIENAIKHGVQHMVEGGCVAVRAFVQEPWLYVTIENPVDPDAPPSSGTGTGLVNIRKRLATLYGERARIGWTRHPNSFLLEMVLPTAIATP